MKEDGYSIRDLEVLSGIKAHTIRIWEKRYNLLNPHRTVTNIRYYSDVDLRKMLNVALLVKKGFKISKIAAWTDDELEKSVLELTEKKTSENDYIDRLLLHTVHFNTIGFNNLAGEIIDQLGLEDAVTNVFFEFFIRVGTYWQAGSIFPSQEHYVTTIFRQKIIAEIDKMGFNNERDSTILFFLPENELHELSLLFYSYLARKMGYHVIYLGQAVPFSDLKKMQEIVDVDFVFTALINAMQKEELEHFLVNLKNLFSKQKVFITGWQIKVHGPQLPRNVKVVKDYREFKKFLR